MFLGCNRYTEDRMENEAGRLPKSRVPPKSKFNDEEATAVLRLIVEQEKILNDATVSPVLNITADKLKRLPPLGVSFTRESFDADDELETSKKPRNHTHHHDNSAQDAVLRKPTLIRAKEQKEIAEDCGTTLGKAKVPQIYSTPKIARPRDKERPRESYGRPSGHLKATNRLPESRANTRLDTHLNRPSNPAGFHREDDMKFRATNSPDRSDVLQLSDELLDRPICPVPPRASSPPSYIN